MRLVRMIQVGPSNSALISNLVSTLNSIQPEFIFSFDTKDVIPYPDGLNLKRETPSGPIEKLVEEYSTARYPNEYAIGICDCLLDENVLTSSDFTKALITTSGWELDSPKYTPLKLITFGMVDILIESLSLPTPSHYEPRACPMDCIFSEKEPLIQKLNTSDFCPECSALIRRAVASNRITIQQMAAIYKILDFIADRKVCFVLMPFNKEFDKAYQKYIQPTLECNGWQCRRADEIHKPSEIINLIWEQIFRADLIIADLTGRNPNVFYELGYTHALGKNTVLLTQSIEDVPFDLRHRQLVSYSATPRGLAKLSEAISKYC